MGLLALAFLGVALALALGFVISMWWLRPRRSRMSPGAAVNPLARAGATSAGVQGANRIDHMAPIKR